MNKISVHWLYNKDISRIVELQKTSDKKPVCIDKDPIAEAILRNVLDSLGILPSEDLHVHLWTIGNNYFFVNDYQNQLLQSESFSICST